MLQLRHFVTFQNATSMQVGGLGLVGDINIGSLDRRTGDIHYHQPWLRPALPKGDWDVIESSIKSYLRDFNSLVQTLIRHTRVSCTCPQSPPPFPSNPSGMSQGWWASPQARLLQSLWGWGRNSGRPPKAPEGHAEHPTHPLYPPHPVSPQTLSSSSPP